MPSEAIDLRAAVLRAYERGRTRVSATRAVVAVVLVGVVASLVVGHGAAPWALVVLPVVFFAERTGQGLARGARRGILVGLVTLLLPLSLLRPCCAPELMELAARTGDMSCCTDWTCCALVGMLLGVVSSFALPRVSRGAAPSTLSGFTAGAMAVAAVRCSSLFWGETLGLLVGLFGALVLASTARVCFGQPAAAA